LQGLTSVTSRNEFPLGLWGKRTIEMEDCAQDAAERDNGTDAGTDAMAQVLDASGERISMWPDPEINHTLKSQLTVNREALVQIRAFLERILKEKN
jgi:hypothetical protein